MTDTVSPDMTLRELSSWAAMQSERLRQGLPAPNTSHQAFVLAQAVKLTEEVGELRAEVLGNAGFQRASKQGFTPESMANEFADVLICTVILACSHNIDLGKAVTQKIGKIEARHTADG